MIKKEDYEFKKCKPSETGECVTCDLISKDGICKYIADEEHWSNKCWIDDGYWKLITENKTM